VSELPMTAPKRQPPTWCILLPGPELPLTVTAWTKSEARAKLKQAFGLGRLPVGTKISREGGS